MRVHAPDVLPVRLSPSAVRVMAAVQRRMQQKTTSRGATSDPAHAAAPTPLKSNPPELYSPGRSPTASYCGSTTPLPPRLPSTRRPSPHAGAMPRDVLDAAADAEWSRACAGLTRALWYLRGVSQLRRGSSSVVRRQRAFPFSFCTGHTPPPPPLLTLLSPLLDCACSECLVIRTDPFR